MKTSRRDLEPVWKALANPVRRQILDLLRDGPLTSGELARSFPALSRFAIAQHLQVLEDGDLVIHKRRGRQRFNYINPVPIQQIYERWVSRYQRPWTEALVSLKEGLEDEQQSGAD